MRYIQKYFPLIVMLVVSACNNKPKEQAEVENMNPDPPAINYTVLKVYPHDTTSYTQGLVWYNNYLYEGTGNYAHSRLMKDDINTGKQIQEVKISNDSLVFGEGIAIMNNKIYELTWQTHTVNIFDVSSLKKLKELYWPSEGWGMTQNGSNLIISTGSDTLYFVNPETFEVVKKITVSDNYGPVDSINELEWVNGYVYANVYLSNTILKIDATTGKVVGRMDMTGIREKSGVEGDPQMPDDGLVLNGIAYDSTKNSLYITGKQWPALFEIKLN